MARRKSQCGKGWMTLEIKRNGKTERVCARFIRPKVKPKGMSWKDWGLMTLDVASGLIRGGH